MINFIKNDFNNVSEWFNYICGRKIPKGIMVLYYIVMLPVGLLIMPFSTIWAKIQLRKIYKELEEDKA